jgi:hypothetical protein
MVTISRDLLMKIVAAEVKRRSFGMTDMDVIDIMGVSESGEVYPIETLQVRAEQSHPAPKMYTPTPPAGRGKLRLVSDNGESS